MSGMTRSSSSGGDVERFIHLRNRVRRRPCAQDSLISGLSGRGISLRPRRAIGRWVKAQCLKASRPREAGEGRISNLACEAEPVKLRGHASHGRVLEDHSAKPSWHVRLVGRQPRQRFDDHRNLPARRSFNGDITATRPWRTFDEFVVSSSARGTAPVATRTRNLLIRRMS